MHAAGIANSGGADQTAPLSFIHLWIKLLEKHNLSNFKGTDYRATELYSSGKQNAAFSYIILCLTYIRDLVLIGRGSSDLVFTLHSFDALFYGKIILFNFRIIVAIFFLCPNF